MKFTISHLYALLNAVPSDRPSAGPSIQTSTIIIFHFSQVVWSVTYVMVIIATAMPVC